MDLLKFAKDFARNPLGIIALFITMIYGFANLLLGSSADKLSEAERFPLIIFIVLFPLVVLGTFFVLVTRHHGKLYAPGDFKDDKSFLRTLTPEEQAKREDKEIIETFGEQADEGLNEHEAQAEILAGASLNAQPTLVKKKGVNEDIEKFRRELRNVEEIVIEQISNEFNVKAEKNIGIGNTIANFDAFLNKPGKPLTFIEVKAFRTPQLMSFTIDRLLYHAVIADKFFESEFKLIFAVVYYFDEEELESFECRLRNMISKCPANIELRLISRQKLGEEIAG